MSVTAYDYRDEAGELLYRVELDPRGRRTLLRPAPQGGWSRSTKGLRRVLYRLPELLQGLAFARTAPRGEGIEEIAAGARVYLLDARQEHAVDRLLEAGLLATCVHDRWTQPLLEQLRGADVVVLPSADEVAEASAEELATRLMERQVARAGRLLILPGQGPGHDLVNWLARNTPLELEGLAVQTPPWRTAPERPRDEGDECLDPYQERGGRTFWVRGSERGPLWTQLANCTARILAQLDRDDGAESTQLYDLEVRVEGRPPRRLMVPVREFGALHWIADAPGLILEPGGATREKLRHAIQVLSAPWPVRTVYAHLGWARDRRVYLHAGGAIGEDGPAADVLVDVPEPLQRYQLPAPPEGADLVRAVRASIQLVASGIAPARIMFPVLGAIYRAPLGRAPHSVFLLGTTGVRKSCLAALAQQHWGPAMDYRALPAGWTSTAASAESLAFAAADALLTVDDFRPVGSRTDQERLHRDADRLFRGAANGAARGRLRADLTHRANRPPRGLILSSGEELPEGASLQARLVILELARGDVDLERLTEAQRAAEAGVYAAAMAGYVRWLAGQPAPSPREEAAELREAYLSEEAHGQTPEALASLELGLRYLARFAAEVGAISEAAAEDLVADGRAALRDVMLRLVAGQAEADPVLQFHEILREAMQSGECHVAGAGGRCPEDPGAWGWRLASEGSEAARARAEAGCDESAATWQAQGVRVGWVVDQQHGGGELYLLPTATVRVLRRMAPWATSTRALGAMLLERGLLLSTHEGGAVRRAPPSCDPARSRVWHLAARPEVAQPWSVSAGA